MPGPQGPATRRSGGHGERYATPCTRLQITRRRRGVPTGSGRHCRFCSVSARGRSCRPPASYRPAASRSTRPNRRRRQRASRPRASRRTRRRRGLDRPRAIRSSRLRRRHPPRPSPTRRCPIRRRPKRRNQRTPQPPRPSRGSRRATATSSVRWPSAVWPRSTRPPPFPAAARCARVWSSPTRSTSPARASRSTAWTSCSPTWFPRDSRSDHRTDHHQHHGRDGQHRRP